MAIAAYSHRTNMNPRTVRRDPHASRQGDNSHRLHHSCSGGVNDLMVFDIWDSPESFEAFGHVLMPILAEVSVDPGEPAFLAVQLTRQFGDGR